MKKIIIVVSVLLSVFFINVSMSPVITGGIVKLKKRELTQSYNSIQKNLECAEEGSFPAKLLALRGFNPLQYQITQRMIFIYITTILAEFLIYLLIVHKSPLLLLILSVIINTVTNPVVNIIYNTICQNVFLLETGVFIVEVFLIFILFNLFSVKMDLPRAIVLSLLANISSYIISTNLAKIIYD